VQRQGINTCGLLLLIPVAAKATPESSPFLNRHGKGRRIDHLNCNKEWAMKRKNNRKRATGRPNLKCLAKSLGVQPRPRGFLSIEARHEELLAQVIDALCGSRANPNILHMENLSSVSDN
jgi:hypothetical protein